MRSKFFQDIQSIGKQTQVAVLYVKVQLYLLPLFIYFLNQITQL